MSNELKLMVGDWVKHNGNYRKIMGYQIDRSNEIFYYQLEYQPPYMAEYGISFVEPIKLTPEIMERIEGMDKVTGNIGNISIAIGLNKYYYITNDMNFHIQYLHQLQQLIRLFTGKEIKVKW